MTDWTTCRVTPETLAELRRAALIEGHDAAHYPTSVVVPTRTLLALLDAAAERDRLAEAVERVRALHIAHDCTSHAGTATICAHRPGICLACLKPLPCPTIRALDTTPETGCES